MIWSSIQHTSPTHKTTHDYSKSMPCHQGNSFVLLGKTWSPPFFLSLVYPQIVLIRAANVLLQSQLVSFGKKNAPEFLWKMKHENTQYFSVALEDPGDWIVMDRPCSTFYKYHSRCLMKMESRGRSMEAMRGSPSPPLACTRRRLGLGAGLAQPWCVMVRIISRSPGIIFGQ